MSYSINTNIAGLQAQDYLRITTDFQAKTINRVTSGMRIVSSGDDAAAWPCQQLPPVTVRFCARYPQRQMTGCPVCRRLRRRQQYFAVARRARTLAAPIGIWTLTGTPRAPRWNSEFQSVLSEIDRRHRPSAWTRAARSPKSAFRCSSSGGRANNGIDRSANGSVGSISSTSPVDSKSLGFEGDAGRRRNAGTPTSGASSDTSVSKILGRSLPTHRSEAVAASPDFYFRGAGSQTPIAESERKPLWRD